MPAKRPYKSCFKHVYAGGAKQQGVLLDMRGEALRVDFPIVTLPTSNMNQQNLSAYVHPLYSAQKVDVDKTFVWYVFLDLTQPYETSGGWFYFIIAISLKFDLPPCASNTWCDFSHVAIA